jgi:HSP20 family molecular chaperone IbpA
MAASNSNQEISNPIRVGRKFSAAFDRLEERVRERAYQIFLGRESGEGDSITDWLEAQLQVLAPVELVVKEQKKNVVVEGNLKGFKPKDIEIEVGPGELKVFGSHVETKTSRKGGETRSSSQKAHFYQIVPLPCDVDADACQAKLLKNGKFKITLPKSAIIAAGR